MRGDLWQVGGRLRIPLGGTRTYALLSPQARRMQERIERDDDIITVQSGPGEGATFTLYFPIDFETALTPGEPGPV